MIPRPLLNLFRSNVADIGTPTVSSVTKNSFKVTGTVTWYKDGATWGVAYKKHADDTWTHSASTSQSISKTISSLTAETKYDVKLYVKFDNVYQYGPTVEETTLADTE